MTLAMDRVQGKQAEGDRARGDRARDAAVSEAPDGPPELPGADFFGYEALLSDVERAKLAELRGLTLPELARLTTGNARRVYPRLDRALAARGL